MSAQAANDEAQPKSQKLKISIDTSVNKNAGSKPPSPSHKFQSSLDSSKAPSLPKSPKSVSRKNPSANDAASPGTKAVNFSTRLHPIDRLQSPLDQTFKKNIVGDVFGTQTNGIEGLMYRSRVVGKVDPPVKRQVKEEVVEAVVSESVATSVGNAESSDESEDEMGQFTAMNSKQQLALTMRNWTTSKDNDQHIIREGGVQALIALCHVEDASIRKYCASAFYNISSREQNRQELLTAGATNGVVLCLHGSPPRCSWKVAKLCALTLCNLSMQINGESTMALENAVGALVQLSTYRGPALLPICIQALYNMTSASEHFKGIERIIKAFLNISSSFDYSVFLVRALVNCSRYSWLRLRIIEDGALSCLHALLPNLPSLAAPQSLVFDMLTALRSLSDSSGCRVDMLLKGSVDILQALQPYCDERGFLLTIKILHNFLAASSAMSKFTFDLSVQIAVSICQASKDPVVLQYCAACIHLFTKEEMRGIKRLALGIIDCMSVLLKCTDPLSQFFAISSSGNLFFKNLCDNAMKVEQLVLAFVEHGPAIKDPAANQALALALAKLSQEQSYMVVIEKLGLLKQVLELLLKLLHMHQDSLLLKESCCIAICRIALKIDGLQDSEKERIASVFCAMLETDDQYVLESTISGICALGSFGLCHKQLLSPSVLSRIASIVARYRNVIELCRTGCAVLAVFSYDIDAHDMLAAEDIMSVLFANIQAEDGTTREFVATLLCNVSVNSVASNMMIKMGVVEVLAALSSSTSETILELCAKCICNLTCNVTLHPKMMENRVLETILMISLVRTVSASTKLICAKALLNLITDDNLIEMKNSGAVRVFAALSLLPNARLQQICSKGFYLLTLNVRRRQTLISSAPALKALYNMVKCQSSRTRIRIGTAVCNLLSCPATNKAAIAAGALSVVKIIATMDFEELREATARVIINLAQDESLHSLLLQQPIVEVLVLILQQSSGYTFECAMMAMSCLSQTNSFKPALIGNSGIKALIATILTSKVCTPLVAEEVCRCFCHLSYDLQNAESMVLDGHLVLSLQAIYLSGLCSADTSLLIALTIRNLSVSLPARRHIIDQGAFKLVVNVISDFAASKFDCTIMYSATVALVYNLSLVPEGGGVLMQQGLMGLLKKICLRGHVDEDHGIDLLRPLIASVPFVFSSTSTTLAAASEVNAASDVIEAPVPRMRASLLFRKDPHKSIIQLASRASDPTFEVLLKFTRSEVDLLSKTINLLTRSPHCHAAMVAGGVMRILEALVYGLSEGARIEVASALANLAASKDCRPVLVQQSAGELLIALSVTSDSDTQSHCALALGYLSEITRVNSGVVASLLLLSLNLEENKAADPAPQALEAPAETPSKTLTNLLRDVMVEKTTFDHYHSALVLKASEVTTDHTGHGKLLIAEENVGAIHAEEAAMLRCDFHLYCLETASTSDTYESESGGMSVNVLMELPLPGIPADRDLEPLNRHAELTKLHITELPVPKDCHPPYHVDSKAPPPESRNDEGFSDEDSKGSEAQAVSEAVRSSQKYRPVKQPPQNKWSGSGKNRKSDSLDSRSIDSAERLASTSGKVKRSPKPPRK